MLPPLRFLGHATVLVELAGFRLLTDPVLRDRLAFLGRVAPGEPAGLGEGLDAVLLSHLHHDHTDLPSLRSLPRDLTVLVPDGAGPVIRPLGFRSVVELEPGQTWTPAGSPELVVRATPAVHDGRRTPLGPRARALGYLIEAGGTSVYFAGDTDIFAGMARLHPSLDVALVPVWGWGPNLGSGHLDPVRAAEALALLRPRFAVPIHWGTLFPLGLRRVPRVAAVLHEPPRRFRDEASRVAPDCRVLLTEPGDVVRFDP